MGILLRTGRNIRMARRVNNEMVSGKNSLESDHTTRVQWLRGWLLGGGGGAPELQGSRWCEP